MDNTNKTSYTAAEMREAFVRGAHWFIGPNATEANAEALRRYPDPIPDHITLSGGVKIVKSEDVPEDEVWLCDHGTKSRIVFKLRQQEGGR